MSKKKWISENKGIFVVLVIAAAIGIDNFRIMPFWDNNIYLRDYAATLENLEFSLSGILSFRYCGHMSQAIALFVLPAHWLGGENWYYVFRGFVFLSGLWMTVEIYCIIGKACTNSPVERTIITLAIIIFPSVLPMKMISPDDFSLQFLVFLTFCYVYKYHALQFLAASLFLFTKEPNIVLYAGLCCGLFFEHNILRHREKDQRLSFIACLNLALPAAIWLALYVGPTLIARFTSIQPVNAASEEAAGLLDKILNLGWNPSSGANTFGIDLYYIKRMILQTATFHFMWLILLAACGALFITLFRKKASLKDLLRGLWAPACGALFELIFLCLYFTYNFYRYRFTINYLLLLVCYVLIGRCFAAFHAEKWSACIFAALAVLAGAEAYDMFDPVTIHVGRDFPTGNGTNISVTHENLYISDAIVNNHQGMEYALFMQEILRETEYTAKDLIVFPRMLERDGTANHLGVYCYWPRDNYYDETTGTLYLGSFYHKSGETVNRACLWGDGHLSTIVYDEKISINDYEHVYVINYPYMDAFDTEKVIEEHYSILRHAEAEFRSWKTDVLQIK